MKILNTIGSVYTPAAKPTLESIGEVSYQDLGQDEVKAVIGDYDVAVVGLGLNFDKEVLIKGKNLKVIATATTGLDHIDIKCARERGIEVISLRGEDEFLDTITGTAELAAGLMISLLRFIPHAYEAVKRYEWDREQFRGRSLHGLTLGVVGMGRLGKWMARYGRAFGMNVLYTDPNVSNSVEDFQKVSFDELLKKSDIVSLHVHLSEDTKDLFNIGVFSKMKRGAYLINTSRGGIVDEKALLGALKTGTIAGYGTDVLADELSFGKTFEKHPLVEYAKENRNVIIVPHIGGMTKEAREKTDIFIAKKLKLIINKK